jgi:hypothetical protein
LRLAHANLCPIIQQGTWLVELSRVSRNVRSGIFTASQYNMMCCSSDDEPLPSPALKTASVAILVHLISKFGEAAFLFLWPLSLWPLSLLLSSAPLAGPASAAAKIRAGWLRRCTSGFEGSGSKRRAAFQDPAEQIDV